MTSIEPDELSQGPGVDTRNPWPGLVAFTEELQGFFHGHGEETDELLRRVRRKNLTVLFGQSGLGKSSLLQAGLFPCLRAEGYLPVFLRLDHSATSLPLSEQVRAAIARAILDAGGLPEATPPDDCDTLWEYFPRRNVRLQTRDGRPIRPVLVFDQFEELFAIGQASDESRSRAALFLAELADLVEDRAPQDLEQRIERDPELAREFVFDTQDYRALICIREDYLPNLRILPGRERCGKRSEAEEGEIHRLCRMSPPKYRGDKTAFGPRRRLLGAETRAQQSATARNRDFGNLRELLRSSDSSLIDPVLDRFAETLATVAMVRPDLAPRSTMRVAHERSLQAPGPAAPGADRGCRFRRLLSMNSDSGPQS